MNRTQRYEFRVFPADENGEQNAADEFTVHRDLRDGAAARRRAGTLAKRHNGPVDVAYACEAEYAGGDWADRYITTASPSDHHASGVRYERIES